MIYAYSPDALVYDSESNSWSLRTDYDYTQHRVEINFTDDDDYLDGDFTSDEVGSDANQTAIINDMDGNEIASGQVYSELYFDIQNPSGETFYLDVIEINGFFVGFIASPPLETGVSYNEIRSRDVRSDEEDHDFGDSRLTYSALGSVPCFHQGTTLMTDEGPQPVDWIRPGDRVLTKDHGFQPVIWSNRTVISKAHLKFAQCLRPVKIAAQSVNGEIPKNDLLLSPDHRILLKSPMIQMLFGHEEVFTAIKTVTNGDTVAQTLPDHAISYFHILFEQHEVILAEGLWVESFFPGKMALAALPAKMQAQIRGLLKGKTDSMQTARFCLLPKEAALITPNKAQKNHHHLFAA